METVDFAPQETPATDGVPLYVRLAMSLRARIYQSEWKLGDRLPPFEEIASHYGVALNTVRKAVQFLSQEGLVSTARGLGTRVVSAAPPMAHPNVRAAINDPLVVSPDVTMDILADEEGDLPAELVEDYQLARRYQRVYKVHSFRGTPFALLDIYVDRDVYRHFPRGSERSHKLSQLLRDHGGVKIASSREELTISHADQRISALLRYSIAAPLVRLRRWRISDAGTVVYACVAIYRGDLFVWDVTQTQPSADHFGAHIIPDVRPR